MAAATVLLAGCYAPVQAAPEPTPTQTPVAPYGDGALVIGVLLPITGLNAERAAAEAAGVELAVREMNDAGAIGGVPVIVHHRDSGAPGTGVLAASFDDLLARGADVIVGPADPTLLGELAPLATAARIPVLALAGAADGEEPTDDGFIFASAEAGAPSDDFLRRLRSADPGLIDPTAGSEAYIAATTAALAALAAGDDGGASIARAVPRVTEGAIPCASYAECAEVLTTQDAVAYAFP